MDIWILLGLVSVVVYVVGVGVVVVDVVMLGEDLLVFCVVWFLGYYVISSMVMGFCLFNNIVIVVVYVCDCYGLEWIVVVDFDVYYGNGIQDIFQYDVWVFYYSIYQVGLFFNLGLCCDRGVGNLMNILLFFGSGGFCFCNVWVDEMLLVIDDFCLQLLLILVGFDVYLCDLQVDLMLEIDDFVWIIWELYVLVCCYVVGWVVLMLEGGYDLQVFVECSVVYVWVLLLFFFGSVFG